MAVAAADLVEEDVAHRGVAVDSVIAAAAVDVAARHSVGVEAVDSRREEAAVDSREEVETAVVVVDVDHLAADEEVVVSQALVDSAGEAIREPALCSSISFLCFANGMSNSITAGLSKAFRIRKGASLQQKELFV